ncbi:amidohydrolase family protein [Undibacterium seohonense]|uniref:Amidohydrolase family protein n=1 Tax=Undibacterium seohonense TaxID=1344950 RepID=A0ABR6X920_9BURK|nr:amidohydrolase family protein [Undibacterium seohonense]MBC3809218.1 amidohydrolase family protein [Undibacterium seohonense]
MIMALILTPKTIVVSLSVLLLISCSSQPIRETSKVSSSDIQPSSLSTKLVATDRCQFSEGTSPGLVIEGKMLNESFRIEDQSVYIQDDKIVDINTSSSLAIKYPNTGILKCENAYFAPGFINAHEHTSFSYQYPDPILLPDYLHREEWQKGLHGKYALKYDKSTQDPKILFWIELRHLLAGETVIAGSGYFDGLLTNISSDEKAKFNADLATFPFTNNMATAFKPYCDDRSSTLPNVGGIKDKILNSPYVPHIGEGSNCVAEGEILAYFKFIKDSPDPRRKFSMIHAIPLEIVGAKTIKDNQVSVIWSPRSNLALYGTTLDPIKLIDQQVSLALGTDWSPSGSFNILAEMNCAHSYTSQKSSRPVSGNELWKMTTSEAAVSLGINNIAGSISVGKLANIIVVDDASAEGSEAIYKKTNADILSVIMNGQLLIADRTKVKGEYIQSNCLAVAGNKGLCVDVKAKYGFTFDDVKLANAANVDLTRVDRQAMCQVK